MAQSESALERSLRVKVEGLGHGVRCLKFVSPGCTGVPDREILLPGGRVVFVEMKRPGQTEGPRQIFVQERLRELGFPVYSTVRSPEQVDEVVEECRKMLEEVLRGG